MIIKGATGSIHILFILTSFSALLSCDAQKNTRTSETTLINESKSLEPWALGPFEKENTLNPILTPDDENKFVCPIRRKVVQWEAKDVFNPAAVVKGNKIYLLYRAEDTVGIHAGTSRIGLAESTDGFYFKKLPQPVFYPSNDFMKKYEWEGGIEDPRVVEDEKGKYIMTYTAYDGKTARLCVSVSSDLLQWEKKGPAFGKVMNGKYIDLWSKSGAIVSKLEGNRLVAQKINGLYWMYWGDVNMNVATSSDLIEWTPLENEDGSFQVVFAPRPGKFDSRLVEPGPPPILKEDGILFIYNSMNLDEGGDPALPAGTYAAGQVLLDASNPTKLLQRTENYFLHPEQEYEITGQIGNVCFLEGLVYFNNSWFLYYGTADSKIAVATYNP
ncbi:MAG: glycoside hydrolase family 130 protein [Bacteroidota bacterium]|nr:glycoside hydrolase family 130 protein [Bacteroidota bacterium]